MSVEQNVKLTVNGKDTELTIPGNQTLLQTLRGQNYMDVKSGCEKGDCGACAVLVDGEAVDSCLTLTATVHGCEITTLVGLQDGEALHPLQEAFIDNGAIQCGYCSPGLMVAAQSMLNKNPDPSEADIRQALSGNLCRCTGYTRVFQAIADAAQKMRSGNSGERAEQGS